MLCTKGAWLPAGHLLCLLQDRWMVRNHWDSVLVNEGKVAELLTLWNVTLVGDDTVQARTTRWWHQHSVRPEQFQKNQDPLERCHFPCKVTQSTQKGFLNKQHWILTCELLLAFLSTARNYFVLTIQRRYTGRHKTQEGASETCRNI